MRYTLLLLTVGLIPPQAPEVIPDQAPNVVEEAVVTQAPDIATHPKWYSPEEFIEGMEWFKGDKTTQAISINVDQFGTRWNHIEKVSIASLEPKWHVSGGMLGITGWESNKFRYIPEDKEVKTWIQHTQVENSSGDTQPNKAIKRKYPVGTRFDDILSNKETKEVFEHRVRRKELFDGKERWVSEVIYENEKARPEGYNGLSVSCSSCHRQAGTGVYGVGLIPGGDTIISDPLNWSVWEE